MNGKWRVIKNYYLDYILDQFNSTRYCYYFKRLLTLFDGGFTQFNLKRANGEEFGKIFVHDSQARTSNNGLTVKKTGKNNLPTSHSYPNLQLYKIGCFFLAIEFLGACLKVKNCSLPNFSNVSNLSDYFSRVYLPALNKKIDSQALANEVDEYIKKVNKVLKLAASRGWYVVKVTTPSTKQHYCVVNEDAELLYTSYPIIFDGSLSRSTISNASIRSFNFGAIEKDALKAEDFFQLNSEFRVEANTRVKEEVEKKQILAPTDTIPSTGNDGSKRAAEIKKDKTNTKKEQTQKSGAAYGSVHGFEL